MTDPWQNDPDRTTRKEAEPTWEKIQDDLRAGVYGDWWGIHRQIQEYCAEVAPDEGISSSDVNHIAYGWVKSGQLQPIVRA